MKLKLFLALLTALTMASGVVSATEQEQPTQPLPVAQGDKSDGDECTGSETAGRCTDKCPPQYFVRGFDKETGAVVCGHVTGCPYGDSIPMADCDKFAPPQEPTVVVEIPIEARFGK